MYRFHRHLFAAAIAVATGNFCSGQSTFTKVYNIFQGKCMLACHSGAAPSGQLDLSSTETDVYNRLIGIQPTNPAAKGKGDKLVDPGYPHRSFLLRKINNGLDPDNGIIPAEGSAMPSYPSPALHDSDVALIQSWILWGAQKSGNVFYESAIGKYYGGKGMAPMPKPAAPPTNDGIQVHFGSLYLSPGEETEYFLKHSLNYSDTMEIVRIESFINIQSHHYLIYKFDKPSDTAGVPEGLRKVTSLFNATTAGTTLVAAWQSTDNIALPQGTAYFWEGNVVLDLDLHIRNYSPDSILRADVYSNIYLRPKQSSTIRMFSELVFYKDPPQPCSFPFNGNCNSCVLNDFCIPNNGQPKVFTDAIYKSSSSDTLYVWLLASHAHKFGKDYDIYLRNSNGTKGAQIYEGFYNFNYTFNQGYFDFQDPPVRYFVPQMPVAEKTGFIHEAKYVNDSNVSVTFGITTSDEMMAIFRQYTRQLPVASTVVEMGNSTTYAVYPNPARDRIDIDFFSGSPSGIGFDVYDLLGRKCFSTPVKHYPSGLHHLQLNLSEMRIQKGSYFIKMNTDDGGLLRKIVVMD